MDNWNVGGTNSSYVLTVGSSSINSPSGMSVHMEQQKGMPANIFFKLMKRKMGILEGYRYKNRIKKIEQAIKVAEYNGQIAFSEELIKKLFVLMREAELWAQGRKMFLSKEIYTKFRQRSKRPVSLTPFANYARVIPDDVLAEKKKCEDLKLFDGYMIMHYDDGKTVKETEAQKQERREKDPILFGTVDHSDRLYFIADWEDEYCDLTLEAIIDCLELDGDEITLPKKPTL